VLRQLPRPTDPNLLVGTDHFDDAGVYRLDDERALVMTVDFFPPLVDDPYTFGRIAAANSLSDIYAMGGRPFAALNIVGFPDDELDGAVLGEILRGGSERLSAAGAVIAGGHSVRDKEIKFGLSVTGLVHPDRIWTNDAAQPGDALVLTKPLGTGTLTTAVKKGKSSADEIGAAIAGMVELNAAAAEAGAKVRVHAATDVTGFGLVGHAAEIAEASGVGIEINADRVPLYPHTMKWAAQGVITRAHKSNLEYLGSRLKADGVAEVLVKVLADAQTSGGLLLAVPEQDGDALVKALKEKNVSSASVIGHVTFGGDALVSIK